LGTIKEKDKLNWNHISQYQELSEDFIQNFKESKDSTSSNIKTPRRCCVCSAIEEYIEPDKEGKVYCYKHCIKQ